MKLSAFRNPKPIAALALIALAFLIALALSPASPSAQAQQPPLDTPTPAPETDLDFPPPDAKKPPLGNLDSMLSRLVERVEQGISTANAAAATAPISRGESIAVTFYTQGDATTLADFLRANGGDPRNVGEGYVEAYVPVTLLVRASEQPGVIRVNAIVPPQPAGAATLTPDSLETQSAPAGRGSVVSQGVALHGADAWHAAGYTGAGVKVGIIDTGFAGFSALMGSELPANVTARCYTGVGEFSSNLADCESSESSQGVPVAETLLDIAPDVDLYISNPPNWGDLKTTVDWMVSQDVDVINHSVSYLWDGPGDGTSPNANSPLKSVDAAVSGGAVWANAAGGYARRTWYGQFTDADGDGWLNFVGQDELNEIEIAAGEKVRIQLRWDDTWTAADTDLDLYLYNANDLNNLVRVDSGSDSQAGLSGDRPFEWISYTPTTDGTYGIAIFGRSGATPRWVQLQSWSRANIRHYTESGSIGSPAESANPGLLAVGAARYWNTNTIAWFSSRGPAPDGRTKPDIMGATCAQVASRSPFLVSGQQCWLSGTGASSPHVAGLAALVKDAFPAYTPAQIADYLKTHAQPRGIKPNNDWGHGFAKLPAPPQTTTPVGGDLAGRVGALEQQNSALQQLLQNLQSLLQALNDRIAALERGGGVAPIATPVGDDACVQSIVPSWTAFGTWTSACVTDRRPLRATAGPRYARFYTFTLQQASTATITLTSDATPDTYMYLLAGAGRDGAVLHQNDDIDAAGGNYGSRISETLPAGSYTIVATTFLREIEGEFILEIRLGP